MNIENQIKETIALLDKAYAPYSQFHVSCLLVFNDETMIGGVNFENSSFGATVCAERNAVGTMITQGIDPQSIGHIIIACNKDVSVQPCGICRQTLIEFFPATTKVILTNQLGEYTTTTLEALLPNAYVGKQLNV